MSERSSDEFAISKKADDESIPAMEAHSIESLPARSREAIWRLLELLQVKARVPVFALVGEDKTNLTNAALAFCSANNGQYIRMSDHISQHVLSNPNFREEWITGYYLAGIVTDLADKCQASYLIVDDWEIILALAKLKDSQAHLRTLRTLAYRPLLKPAILVLTLGKHGFESTEEVKHLLEVGGRERVVTLKASES